jgi:hypothetical protein
MHRPLYLVQFVSLADKSMSNTWLKQIVDY